MPSSQEEQVIRIRLLWLPQAQFAGYLLAQAQSQAADESVRIVCEPADLKVSPTVAVLEGEAEFAVASPAHIVESGAPDDLVWLLTIQQESPLLYPVWRDSGIETPLDLKERSVAIWPGNEDLEFQWMVKRAGLDPATVRRKPVGDTVTPFLNHDVDCAQMTCYHELHVAEAQLSDFDAIRVFYAADYGASLIKDGLIARRDWVERNTDQVQTVVDAVLSGWTIAFDDRAIALEACVAARPDMDREDHQRQLADIRALSLCGPTLTHGLGYPDREHARRAVEAAESVGIGKSGLVSESMVMSKFWESAPEVSRRRAW